MRNFSKSKSLFAVIACTLISTSAFTNELKASVDIGFDSNPFRLSSELDPTGAEFVNTNIKGQYDLSESLYLTGRLKDQRYGSEAEDANNYKAQAGIGFEQKVDWFDNKATLSSELTTGLRDKTYVSRLSGDIGESGGDPIEDRYDYQFWHWESDLQLKWDKKNTSTFFLKIESRDYEDYDLASLSNFDYTEYTAGIDWKHKLSKKSAIKFDLGKNYRDFEDRRELDLSGSAIDSTNLSYDGWQLGLKYSQKINKTWRLSLAGQYDYRQDSGSGYYDWERRFVRTSVAYKADKYSTFKASIAYHNDSYDKRANGANPDEEELSAEQGLRYRLNYERKLPSFPGLSVVSSLRYDDVDADIESYQYDRSQLALGIKYRF